MQPSCPNCCCERRLETLDIRYGSEKRSDAGGQNARPGWEEPSHRVSFLASSPSTLGRPDSRAREKLTHSVPAEPELQAFENKDPVTESTSAEDFLRLHR